jgi:hypothetical protein
MEMTKKVDGWAPLRVSGEMSCQPTCMRFNYNHQLLMIEGARKQMNYKKKDKKKKKKKTT